MIVAGNVIGKQIIDNIFSDDLEHTNGYWVGRRSRLFHSAAVNPDVSLPVEEFNKTFIVEWNEQSSNSNFS